MIGDACVFALTQITNDFACQYGELVTRRAGPDIACQSAEQQSKCLTVYEHLKHIGLQAFDYEDDLGQVPHGVWAKIQFGGLLGLQALFDEDNESRVENISQTISFVQQEFAHLDQLPQEKVIAAMQRYRSRRRKK